MDQTLGEFLRKCCKAVWTVFWLVLVVSLPFTGSFLAFNGPDWIIENGWVNDPSGQWNGPILATCLLSGILFIGLATLPYWSE